MKEFPAARLVRLAAIVVSTTLISSNSVGAPQFGATVIVETDGEVVATLGENFAGYTNELYLESPANSLGLLFTNKMTPVTTVANLGSFTAGTELVFRMHVVDTGDDFYTGPASRNVDSIVHAYVDEEFVQDASYVAFEDQNGGGDLNFADLTFSLSNTRAGEVVPEPAACLLGGFGFGLLGFYGWRRART